jgi:hypothetical protein
MICDDVGVRQAQARQPGRQLSQALHDTAQQSTAQQHTSMHIITIAVSPMCWCPPALPLYYHSTAKHVNAHCPTQVGNVLFNPTNQASIQQYMQWHQRRSEFMAGRM